MMQTSVLVLVRLCGAVVWVLAFPFLGTASLYLQEYDPLRHDRFCEADGTAFIGEGFDFSGVGHTSDVRWVTMISPTYFVSAAHRFPYAGSKVTFYEGNEKSDDFAHQYVVDDFSVTMYWNGQPSDLKVGRLVVPDDQTEAILPEDNITWYPIIPQAEFSYSNAELFVYGLTDRVGKNDVSKICSLDNRNSTNPCITEVMEFLYTLGDLGQGADEAYVMSGDSGAPSFVVYDEQLALAGIHYYNYGSYPLNNYASGDSFVPAYSNQITAFPIEGDVSGDQLVDGGDLDLLRTCWGETGDYSKQATDLSGDGRVGIEDLDLIREYWHQTGPAPWINDTLKTDDPAAVPEPSVFPLMVILAAALSGCCRLRV